MDFGLFFICFHINLVFCSKRHKKNRNELVVLVSNLIEIDCSIYLLNHYYYYFISSGVYVIQIKITVSSQTCISTIYGNYSSIFIYFLLLKFCFYYFCFMKRSEKKNHQNHTKIDSRFQFQYVIS